MSQIAQVSPAQARQALEKAGAACRLIDVRTPVEFQEVHAVQAELLPLQDLNDQTIDRAKLKDGPVYLICKSGARAEKAAALLKKAGARELLVVTGGTDAWVAAGLPVERGKAVMSLERQVRIAVGSMVLVFALLALTVNPLFALGCAFFGAGLTFAGITGWCGLGLLLARMPWNQGAACKTCAP